MSTKLTVEVPATMTKLADAMMAVVKLVEAQVERGTASGPSSYDEFEQSLMEAVAGIERSAHEPAAYRSRGRCIAKPATGSRRRST
jgi:hypothetical protein